VGRGGVSLEQHWAGEPRAYLGITVAGFPNFFMLYGPGTNGGDIVSMLEAQAKYAVRAVKCMMRRRVTAIEVKSSYEDRWYQWLQSKMSGTSWLLTNNYFTTETGKVVTQWPLRQPRLHRAHAAARKDLGHDATPRAVGVMTRP
jgi:hypothetical protein